MDVVKKFLVAIILLGVITVIWVGLTFYFDSQKKSFVTDIGNYTQQLAATFQTEELDKVLEKSENALPVQSKEFTTLLGKD